MKKSELRQLIREEIKNIIRKPIAEVGLPSNIASYAKEHGALSDVKEIAKWVEKLGYRVVGGVAIGKGYDTLVLDISHNMPKIYKDLYRGTITVNNKPVDSFKTLKQIYDGVK